MEIDIRLDGRNVEWAASFINELESILVGCDLIEYSAIPYDSTGDLARVCDVLELMEEGLACGIPDSFKLNVTNLNPERRRSGAYNESEV